LGRTEQDCMYVMADGCDWKVKGVS